MQENIRKIIQKKKFLQTQLGLLPDHWLFCWHVIVLSPTSSKAAWHSKVSVSPCRKLLPVLFPYDGIPGSPQPPFSISAYWKIQIQQYNSKENIFVINLYVSIRSTFKIVTLHIKLIITAENKLEVNAIKLSQRWLRI